MFFTRLGRKFAILGLIAAGVCIYQAATLPSYSYRAGTLVPSSAKDMFWVLGISSLSGAVFLGILVEISETLLKLAGQEVVSKTQSDTRSDTGDGVAARLGKGIGATMARSTPTRGKVASQTGSRSADPFDKLR
ncbi:hypothetical protein [Flavimaricola marinus]|uniref:Uncharacterized protein n=1 Tax=Flavimaricola marinus TaxID=1819565 RepID=A0A238LG69_9RHOB|nr:hypothetical protein [Flavimaricola marinus]SMY08631.1 hypothetical protein LOM8899_02786 [Flavimaricola marinus]